MRELIVPSQDASFDGVREYAFKHQILHHVAYDTVLKADGIIALKIREGDELIGVGGWRLRRLDDTLRFVAPGAPAPLVVGRDQRLLELRFDPAALAGDDSGAVQLRRAEAASADAQRLREAWISG